jgi:hypothetical protein
VVAVLVTQIIWGVRQEAVLVVLVGILQAHKIQQPKEAW